MRRILLLVFTILAAVAALAWWRAREAPKAPAYRFVAVERGDLEALVSSTGTLEPVTTVSVGTQVGGIVAALYADFNDVVREGQVVARIDPTLYDAAVEEAKATLARTRAELTRSEAEGERVARLYEQGIVPPSDRDDAIRTVAVAKANLAVSAAGLARAERNLAFTTIRSPISGIVVARSVDVGQTVAASLQAPELFRIAADLARLQILAAVDESDIGRIEVGQEVRFAVQTYPTRRFEGSVRQVRLQPVTQDNVVHYTVVVDVANPEEKLLPGMTATVDFRIAAVSDVFLVPSSALRFRPTESMIAELRARREAEGRGPGSGGGGNGGSGEGAGSGRGREGGGGRAREGAGPGAGGAGGGGGRFDRPRLFFLDAQGKLDAIPVEAGLSDGQKTEVSGPGLEEGLQVIVGVTEAATSTPSNPFQSQQQRGPGGFRRPPGGLGG